LKLTGEIKYRDKGSEYMLLGNIHSQRERERECIKIGLVGRMLLK
jgi:hypothetical protein